jgi:hypothetical protein
MGLLELNNVEGNSSLIQLKDGLAFDALQFDKLQKFSFEKFG